MIGVVWRDPNFVAEIKDADGVVETEIHWAESQQRLEEQLQARVTAGEIHAVQSVKPYNFEAWKKRAKAATDQVKRDYVPGKPHKFKSAIWTDLKPYLRQLFREKCAYCEARFTAVTWGDVEHYRPKARVNDLNDETVLVEGNPHPGYYWLAYDPTNLMPSCQLCNQAFGKMNRFPIAPGGTRGSKPGDPLAGEDPMLLSPYEPAFSCRTHLEFVTKKKNIPIQGIVRARTPRGEASIKGYRLNRAPLIKSRAEAQLSFLARILVILAHRQSLREEKLQYAAGVQPFSAAVLTEIEDWEEDVGISIPI